MQLSALAVDKILSSNKLMGRLMGAFDRHQKTIQDWVHDKDIRLTTPMAISIIKEETGLDDSEILEPIKESQQIEHEIRATA